MDCKNIIVTACIIASAMLFAGCRSLTRYVPSIYEMDIKAVAQDLPKTGGFIIVPQVGSIAEWDANFERFSKQLSYLLEDKGMYPVDTLGEADYQIVMGYDIGLEHKKTDTIEFPYYESVPIRNRDTGEIAYYEERLRTRKETYQTSYKELELQIASFPARLVASGIKPREIWRVDIKGEIPHHHLEYALPVYIGTAAPYFASNKSNQVSIPYQPKRKDIRKLKEQF